MASLWSAPRPLGASGLASWSLQRPGHSHHGPARWSGQPQPHPLTQPRPLSAGPRSLGGSVPVTVPGCPPRSPSLHSSSSLSTSPLSSLSQSLSGPLVSSAMTPPQQPPALRSEPGALGPSAASYSSLGEPGPPTWLHRLDSGAATARGGPLSSLLAVLWGKRMGCTRSLLSGWPCHLGVGGPGMSLGTQRTVAPALALFPHQGRFTRVPPLTLSGPTCLPVGDPTAPGPPD